jgi:hypothetical protein
MRVMNYDRLGLLVPDGYQVVETENIVPGSLARFYPQYWIAVVRRDAYNETVRMPSYRYVVERGPGQFFRRWMVVTKQNVLRKVEPS